MAEMDEFFMALTEADDQPEKQYRQEERQADNQAQDTEDIDVEQKEQGDVQPKDAGKENADDVFCLRHLDRQYTVNREQALALAQKGLDYDRIRADRDGLRQYKQQTDPVYELTAALAGDAGMTVPDYLKHTARERLIKGGVEPELARQQTEHEYAVRRAKAEQQELYAQVPDADLSQLPEDFWQKVKQGKSLLSAYLGHENEQLKARIEAESQQQLNRTAAASSRRSAGDTAAGDPFLTEFMKD